jgi:DNA-binding transcriptional MocR family regulator
MSMTDTPGPDEHLAAIGDGRNDPRRWVQAAYLLIDAIDSDPDGKPPTRSEIAAKLGIHQTTVARAYRELRALGIIRHVPGHGILRAREASQNPHDDDAGRVVITITLPEGTGARVRITGRDDSPSARPGR